MQPGTVEAEMIRRRRRKEQREDDRLWAELQARREAERKTLRARLAAILDHIKIWLTRS